MNITSRLDRRTIPQPRRLRSVLASGRVPQREARRGSTLLIVLVLMGMLALLGVLFYTFAAQEQAVASSFSNDSRVLTAPALEPDLLMDYALEQLLLGPDDTRVNSALWGGRHSMIPNLLGRDGVPFSGEGVRIIDDSGDPGNAIVDLDFDGSADNSWLLGVNNAPGANGGFPFSAGPSGSGTAMTDIPAPDVDYTYPGFDHLFLAHRALVTDFNNPTDPPVEVILPSFHRPGLLSRTLREIDTTTLTAPTIFFDQPGSDGEFWFGATGATSTTNRVFRPHRGHQYVTIQPGAGGRLTTLGNRFARPSDPPVAADLNALRTLGLTSFFPAPPRFTGQLFGEQGAYEMQDGGSGFARSTRYGYDVDLDGDGILESILLDLDFTPQRRGDGKLVVPMFAFHILDANGLLNLNLVGNLAGNLDLSGLNSRELGNEMPNNPATLARSNLGYSVAEINPTYALSADPGDASLSGAALEQHKTLLTMFGHNDVPRSRRELANMEWLFLNIGRPNWNQSLLAGSTDPDEIAERVTALISGRYGEVTRLQSALALASSAPATLFTGFPFAGTSASDDNQNDAAPRFPFFGTPQDPIGWGDPFQAGGLLLRRHLLTNHPIAYQSFDGYNVGISGGGVDVDWYNVLSQALVQNAESVGRLDEAAEIVVDPDFLSDDDNVYTVDDTAGLHLGASDFSRMAKTSRLRSLASANFQNFRNADVNNPDNAKLIRERFTTLSTDRRELALGRTIQGGNQFRRWESEFDDGTDIVFQFPPNFTGGDPFRTVTRNLLQLDSSERIGRFKLDLNRILRDNSGNPEFRRMRDYSEDELEARQERQNMARDIYVLLYTFCGGADTDGNFTTNLTNSGSSPFTSEHMRQMAQFAVNVVDAVDRDSVMTEFWYDVNLSDGWNEPDHRVFGVERQLLAISEALAVRTPDPTGFTSDHMATMFQENVKTYDYLFLELVNLSPEDLTLYDGTNDEWRIRRDDDDAVGGVEPGEYAVMGTPEELTDRTPRGLLNGQDCIITIRDNTVSLTPGERYVIASQDGTIEGMASALWSSEIRIDLGTGFERVLPAVADTGMPPTSSTDNPASFPPVVDLDLCHDSHTARFLAEVAMPAMADPGCLVRQGGTPITQYRMRLERRAKGFRDAGTSTGQTNGWVIVDKTNIDVQTTWSYDNSSSGTDIRNSLNNTQEQFRAQPLRRQQDPLVTTSVQQRPVSQNTFSTTNTPHDMMETSTANDIDVQLQFDRDLMSIAELLHVPTFAPRDLTNNKYNPSLDTSNLNIASFGLSFFLDTTRSCDGGGNTGNRWYRLLNFFEVTPPLHRENAILDNADVAINSGNDDLALPSKFGLPTLPAQINPNTLRHPEVLAGLLDDQRVLDGFDRQLGAIDTADTPGRISMTRNWWEEFLISRDRLDEVTGIALPGTSVANPFRGFGHLGGADGTQLMANSVLEQTLLRSLPADSENTFSGDADRFEKSRRLFQVSNSTEHTGNSVHPYARHRLLQKVLNNSTTRSNTFLVWVGVQFHEAAIDTNGAVRIGGRLEDTPLHRGFFVIDRAEVVEQVKRLQLLGRTMDHDSTTGILKPQNLPVPVEYFSYRALSSAGADDGIDWRALIKYRQLLN